MTKKVADPNQEAEKNNQDDSICATGVAFSSNPDYLFETI